MNNEYLFSLLISANLFLIRRNSFDYIVFVDYFWFFFFFEILLVCFNQIDSDVGSNNRWSENTSKVP